MTEQTLTREEDNIDRPGRWLAERLSDRTEGDRYVWRIMPIDGAKWETYDVVLVQVQKYEDMYEKALLAEQYEL